MSSAHLDSSVFYRRHLNSKIVILIQIESSLAIIHSDCVCRVCAGFHERPSRYSRHNSMK